MKRRHFDHKTVLYSVALFITFTSSSVSSQFEDEYDYYDGDGSNSSSTIGDDYSSSELSPSTSECSSITSTLRAVHLENRHLPLRKQVPHLNDTMKVIDYLSNLTNALIAVELNAEEISYIFELFYSANVSNQCFLSLAQVGKGILEHQIWALKCKHSQNTSNLVQNIKFNLFCSYRCYWKNSYWHC